MSLLDSSRKGKKQSAQAFIGAECITETSIRLKGGRNIVYFLVEPVNLAVLSASNIQGKVVNLMHILKANDEVELLCLGSREDFEGNKNYLKARLERENCQAVRRLLEQDLQFLDHIQLQTASAREFAFALRFRNEDDISPAVSRMEKLLKEQGFRGKIAGQEDLKRLYAVYFVQNMVQ